jgi:hypothetical protein
MSQYRRFRVRKEQGKSNKSAQSRAFERLSLTSFFISASPHWSVAGVLRRGPPDGLLASFKLHGFILQGNQIPPPKRFETDGGRKAVGLRAENLFSGISGGEY